jgi:hypothetical protein
MYTWIWRHLPGPTAVKALQSLVLLLAVVALLFLIVFPWAQRSIPFLDVTVDDQATPSALAPPQTSAAATS